jgi:hypothetical protein
MIRVLECVYVVRAQGFRRLQQFWHERAGAMMVPTARRIMASACVEDA